MGKVLDGKEWENSLEILGFVFWGPKQGRSRRREEASNLGWPIQSLSSRPLLLGFISLNWPTFCSNIHYTIIQNFNDTLNNSKTPRWSFNNITILIIRDFANTGVWMNAGICQSSTRSLMREVVRAATILVVERVGQSQLIWTPVLTKPRIFKPLIRIINTFPLHKPLRLVSISRKKRIYHYTKARR